MQLLQGNNKSAKMFFFFFCQPPCFHPSSTTPAILAPKRGVEPTTSASVRSSRWARRRRRCLWCKGG
jgi:hypothetical protein